MVSFIGADKIIDHVHEIIGHPLDRGLPGISIKQLKYQLPPGAKLTIYYPGGRKVYIGEEGQPE